MYRLSFCHLIALAVLFSASGATCPRNNVTYNGPPAPVVFHGTPTLDQVVQVINSNSARVQRLQSTGATVRMPGTPALQADIAFERPRRFRLTAGTGLTGTEVDLGSNDELFWYWSQRDPQQAIYYARHAEFQTGAARHVLPVPPQWIVEAFGLVQLDASSQNTGPYPRPGGGLEIRSTTSGATGALTRVLVVHDQYGMILEQHIFDQANQLLASAMTSNHQYDPISGISLPHQIDVQLPPAQLTFTIQIAGYLINQLASEGSHLWAMPQPAGAQPIDLMRAALPPAASTSSWSSQPVLRQQSERQRRFRLLRGRAW